MWIFPTSTAAMALKKASFLLAKTILQYRVKLIYKHGSTTQSSMLVMDKHLNFLHKLEYLFEFCIRECMSFDNML